MASQPAGGKSTRRWPLLLLIIPFIATLYLPFYNTTEPSVLGLPFFYFYLLLWVPISALLTGLVYFLTK
jgi:uncharacterized protein DUF3311